MSKLLHLQFNMSSELAQRPIGSLNGYQLTWFYFGYSRVYACILGLTQVTGATLLLFRKTTLLAGLIMLPVMVNILLIIPIFRKSRILNPEHNHHQSKN
jgi:hypothetical protein